MAQYSDNTIYRILLALKEEPTGMTATTLNRKLRGQSKFSASKDRAIARGWISVSQGLSSIGRTASVISLTDSGKKQLEEYAALEAAQKV